VLFEGNPSHVSFETATFEGDVDKTWLPTPSGFQPIEEFDAMV
jgi:hypothetical protein